MPMKAILHLTKGCNLRCPYCYAGKQGSEQEMTLETAKKAVDLAISEGNGSACISYFGGEPLLKFDLIKEVTVYAEEKARTANCSMHFRMSTNGTLFTEEILKFCADHNILFAMSLDGYKKSHDISRHLPDGSGSFDLIDSRLDMILRYNPFTVVTHVITPENVSMVSDSIRWMYNRGLRFIAHQVDFNDERWDMDLFEVLKSEYEKLAQWYLEASRTGVHFFMTLFDEKLKNHIDHPVYVGDVCDFGKTKISVAPDGSIVPCVRFISDDPDAKGYVIGNVATGFTDKREFWIGQNLLGRPECNGCDLVGRCANYCGCTNWNATGSINTVPPLLCEHERLVIAIADRIGETLWNEKNQYFLKKHYKLDRHLLEMLTDRD